MVEAFVQRFAIAHIVHIFDQPNIKVLCDNGLFLFFFFLFFFLFLFLLLFAFLLFLLILLFLIPILFFLLRFLLFLFNLFRLLLFFSLSPIPSSSNCFCNLPVCAANS